MGAEGGSWVSAVVLHVGKLRQGREGGAWGGAEFAAGAPRTELVASFIPHHVGLCPPPLPLPSCSRPALALI